MHAPFVYVQFQPKFKATMHALPSGDGGSVPEDLANNRIWTWFFILENHDKKKGIDQSIQSHYNQQIKNRS